MGDAVKSMDRLVTSSSQAVSVQAVDKHFLSVTFLEDAKFLDV